MRLLFEVHKIFESRFQVSLLNYKQMKENKMRIGKWTIKGKSFPKPIYLTTSKLHIFQTNTNSLYFSCI